MLFNSIQFNSIQFNSIPKIISLIVLLFILLFSISCKSKQKPEEHSRAELVGIWDTTGASDFYLYVFDDGDILYRVGQAYNGKSIYTEKVASTFDSYPYTVKLIVTNITHNKYADAGRITFNNATNLELLVTNIMDKNGKIETRNWDSSIRIKKYKISKSKEEIWNGYLNY